MKMLPKHPLLCLLLAIRTSYVVEGKIIQNRNEMVTYALRFRSDYMRNGRKGVLPEEHCL